MRSTSRAISLRSPRAEADTSDASDGSVRPVRASKLFRTSVRTGAGGFGRGCPKLKPGKAIAVRKAVTVTTFVASEDAREGVRPTKIL
jgi:hypothetical protein